MKSLFQFQDPGEGIREAEVLDVMVKKGDSVDEGQVAFVVETDKASFDVAAPRSGEVAEVLVQEGDVIEVGDPLLRFDDTETEAEAETEPEPDTEAEAEADTEAESDAESAPESEAEPGRRARPVVKASPATRRLARELEVDLSEVEPSGEAGRVLDEDVRAAAGRAGATTAGKGKGDERRRREPLPDFGRWGEVERVALRSIRRRTAERMAESWARVARVTHHDEADITELERLRRKLAPTVQEEHGAKLTITAMVVKALGALLLEHPRLNSSFDEEMGELIFKRYVNVGVAADTERGLLVPVVHDVTDKGLGELAREISELAEAARDGSVGREQLSGGSFTLTNVGAIGGTGLTPIVNHPEVAILGLGRAQLDQVVFGTLDDHEVKVRLMLPLSLSYDHRAIDGAEGARFVRDLARMLEDSDRFVTSI
ncbi:MAG: dihydrolipoamide acetyltransferase family protein [Myxococcales bacterium]|jgi:pyruvate dehydrogenase E2 component (dihydrolipoamide acetyltransferase)